MEHVDALSVLCLQISAMVNQKSYHLKIPMKRSEVQWSESFLTLALRIDPVF
jgi:hypothetical protein